MSNPRVRRRRAITAGVLAVAVALLGWHYWALYSAATGAKADLESAEQALTGDGFDFTSADVDSASRDLRSARRQVDSARRHARFDPFLATAQANGADYLDLHLREVVARRARRGSVEIRGLGVGLDLRPYYPTSRVIELGERLRNQVFREILELLAPRVPRFGR